MATDEQEEPTPEDEAAAHATSDAPALPGLPRGILVVPFVMAAALTLLVGYALGQSISPTWVFIAILVGAVASISSISWSSTHRPRPGAAAARAHGNGNGGEGNESDPLGHIHAVEKQARRHQRPCPNCGTRVNTKLEHCPNCNHQIIVHCKGCRTRVRLEWANCPECGRELP